MNTLGNRGFRKALALPMSIGKGFRNIFISIARFFSSLFHQIAAGDLWVKSSLLLCGMGYFGRRQYGKGILATLLQLAAICLFPVFFLPYLRKFDTLGDVERQTIFNPETLKNEVNAFDDSFQILLFGVVGILFLFACLILYVKNIGWVSALQKKAEEGKHINSLREDFSSLFHEKFHITLLSLPVICVVVFSVVPLLVMILAGFTNFDRFHFPPARLFTWVGLDNFHALFESSLTATFGYSFRKILLWTLIWAFLATFTNYYGGILLALFINHRQTRFKKFWRTAFVIPIAVPQFVSLLLVRNFFANTGIVNTLFSQWGVTDFFRNLGLISPGAAYIPFLTDPNWAKAMIILINMWVGIPYMMLLSTGVLMNIPGDLLESAQIDGANAIQRFRKITMPYIRFVTGPFLVSSLIGNINNFNIIYLLTNDIYVTSDQLLANSNAREVDLLVTWLYRLTQDFNNYKMASVLGMAIFLICAGFTLLTFSRMNQGNKEETFQ